MTVVEGLDLAAVQKFFDAEVPEVRGPLRAELIHGGRSNLTYRLTDGHSTWVLRRPPLGGLTPSAHDMAREYRVVAGLAGTRVPVARAVALGQDQSILGMQFSVFEYVAGRVIRTKEDLHALAGDCPAGPRHCGRPRRGPAAVRLRTGRAWHGPTDDRR